MDTSWRRSPLAILLLVCMVASVLGIAGGLQGGVPLQVWTGAVNLVFWGLLFVLVDWKKWSSRSQPSARGG